MIRLPRLTAALVLTGALVALSGCAASAPSPSMDSATAAERYESVMDDVVAALEQKYPDVAWSDDDESRVVADGDRCTFVVGTQRGEPSLREAAGGWDAVADVINPVLTNHDLDSVSEQKLEGGWTGVASRDDSGATLDISDKSYTLIELSVPVTDTDC
ncbi:hypothetical protein ITJ38_16455 [Agreia pratensis]|uniref:hypothetical protein n=1 Tax=Agreia pratensis TaxID=150121 RepID=UPI00188B5CBB|nr:hypothetical protein [Agreia pratensis]MBF4636001.1 hypothetical protein [Agreia pratensis]